MPTNNEYIFNPKKQRALYSLLSIHDFTIYHRHHGTKKRRHDCWRNDCCRISAPVLAAISDNIHWYQLQRRDIHHKKRAHLIARSPCLAILQTAQRTRRRCNHKFIVPARPLQLLQVAHCPELPLSHGSDTYFAKYFFNRVFFVVLV